MMIQYDIIVAVILAYLMGSLSSAIIVCKIMRLPDPRTQGSRNPGTTNVLRIGGKKAAIITLIGDVLKGVIPVLLAKWYGLDELGLAMVTLAAFLGHLYPIFFGFEGGKGVATAIGCLVALSWPLGLSLIATWLVVVIAFRYSSLASLVAAVLAPVYSLLLTNNTYTFFILLMSLLLIYRHRTNIKNLLNGTESKLGKSRAR